MSASVDELEAHRVALTGHCYRMLGSLAEADDAVQETIIRAWRALDGFDGRSTLRTWLYRIATNVCLDALAARKHRAMPMEEGPAGTTEDALIQRPRTHWLEPIPDAAAIPSGEDPAQLAIMRQSIRLAFVAALQHLPPKQRAVLLLMQVLGWSAAEAAETLDLSVASVNSALQRARATLASRNVEEPIELSPKQNELLDKYVDAFHRYDVDELASLLRDDVTFSMPPYSLWLSGPDAVRGWLLGRGSACMGSRLLPVDACGTRAFAHYHPNTTGGFSAWALIVLELDADRVKAWHSFLDAASLFPRFGLPLELPD